MNEPFIKPEDLYRRRLFPGVELALAWGENIMLSVVTIEPDGIVPLHSHPHEQAGCCLSGEFELEIDGETRRLKEGDLYIIPSDTPHAARGIGERAVALDIFSPIRKDYLPGEGA